MRSQSHLNTSLRIIQTYDGILPLSAWLKNFFSAEKKYGSKDRKQIAHYCYCYYRLGKAFENKSKEEKLMLGAFLSSTSPLELLQDLRPDWNERIGDTLADKINFLSAQEEVNQIFFLTEELSEEIEKEKFQQSFLVQPDLFLRIRPGKEKLLKEKLTAAGIDFYQPGPDALGMSNQTKLEAVFELDREAVVQDLNSQQVLQALMPYIFSDDTLKVWDCCAASGGKSILLKDHFPHALLTVSDIRKSILINLQKRFDRAGIKKYRHFVADISDESFSPKQTYDLIVCDAPCSGSGTWSRTPEQLEFFKKEKIEHYSTLQKKIVQHAARALRKNGYFLYITCSVFKEENEEVVNFIQGKLPLKILSSQYYKGYQQKADTLFSALFSL